MTIKRRIRIALTLMILVPMTLMMAAFGIARHFSERTERVGPGGSPLIFTAAERDFIAEFNRTVNEEPAALTDPRR
ncbi:MAG: hypothetical protein Q8M76_09455, partial [Spirochaetaceae bacterium]|nr:hypothetical protein [Spirochaetaceae bacterium]